MFSPNFYRVFEVDLRTLFSPLHPSRSPSLLSLETDDGVPAAMQYVNWNTCQHRPALTAAARRHKWCSLVDLCNFVEAHKMNGFHTHASRNVVVAAIARLRTHAPFSRTERFPEDVEFVDLDATSVLPYIDQLHQACDLNDRAVNVGNAQPNGSTNDAKRAFDVAFTKIRDFATAVDFPEGSGVWTRETFETRYGLEWGNPPAVNN